MRKLSAFGLFALALVGAAGAGLPAGAQSSPVQPYRASDRAATALNILPPGQGRYLNGPELALAQSTGQQPEHNTDQVEMYESLVQAAPGVTQGQLTDFFKDASFGVRPGDIAREYSPRQGVVVLRDASFGVPHVYGTSRSDVMYGAGYVSAEDRLFMMDVLRHVGRGRVSEFLGASEANLAMDEAVYKSSAYTEAELQAMIDRAGSVDSELGPIASQDLQAYVDGVNQFIEEARTDPTKLPGEYEALQQAPEDWKATDTAAVASLIGSQLGVGGGGELDNAIFIDALQDNGYSFKQARRILGDFRFADDPEAPVTTSKRFPYMTNQGRITKSSRALPDDASSLKPALREAALPTAIDGPFGSIPLAFPDAASNALLVGPQLSQTGNPLAVFGPQVGYWSPEILLEIDLHGPGIDSRGIGFPGISLYTLLGRGSDYAWSATSAGGDQVDVFAEKLCNPEGGEVETDGTFYLKGGECTEMYTRTDTWLAKPSAGGIPDPSGEPVVVEMTTQRTDNGIVQARGTIKNKPVAFVAQRSTFKKELDSALTYVLISDPARIDGAKDFQRAFARFGFTFNWFYLDDTDIAYQLGGFHPIRARHTDVDLPVWGKKKWDWKGLLSFGDTPKDISPSKGFITSWNNKQAPGFRASDEQFSYGPVYRSQPLDSEIRKAKKTGGKVSLTELVNATGSAATVDLRGFKDLGLMLEVIGKQDAGRRAEAVELLREWKNDGAHRRDKDADGAYEHSSAIALMDEWWPRAVRAIFKPRLGAAYDALPTGIDNSPGPLGSAYQSGLYSHVNKDLRMVLGKKVRGDFSRIYCGKGRLGRCRTKLGGSLDKAVQALVEEFGSDPAG